jgi:hypothetical protein
MNNYFVHLHSAIGTVKSRESEYFLDKMKLVIGQAGDREFAVDAQELVTGRTCIIAQSGAGKSWSIAVLCERLCKAGIGFCLIDTEGEYFSLKDKFPVLWIGSDENCDEDIDTANIREIMTHAVKSGTAVIYDVSETEMQEKASKLANILYDISSELRIPYLLIIEEADKFIPQSRESIKKIEEISRRGRKRGLGLLVATQRPALVTKNVLSQCNNQIIGKLSIENDLKAVDLFFNSRKEVEELADLIPGEFFIMGRLAHEKTKMRFGKRETQHRGLTPQLTPRPKPPIHPYQQPASLEHADHAEAVASVASSYDAVIPRITREEVLKIAQGKRKKKVFGMGTEERVASVEMLYWPLINIEVRYIGGLLKKNTKTASFMIEGREGQCVDIGTGLRLSPCFSELIGLEEEGVRILSCMTADGVTEADLEAATKLARNAVRKTLKNLEEKKLVTTAGHAGKVPIYVPLLVNKIPKLGQLREISTMQMEAPRRPVIQREIEETEMRTVLKGLEPTAEIVAFETFYYPVYEIILASRERERAVFIDAVNGNEITKG